MARAQAASAPSGTNSRRHQLPPVNHLHLRSAHRYARASKRQLGGLGLPVIGTNRTGKVCSVSVPLAVRRKILNSCTPLPMGIAMRPSIFSC